MLRAVICFVKDLYTVPEGRSHVEGGTAKLSTVGTVVLCILTLFNLYRYFQFCLISHRVYHNMSLWDVYNFVHGVWILKAAKMMPNVEFKFLSQIVNLLHVEYFTSKNVLPEEDIHL